MSDLKPSKAETPKPVASVPVWCDDCHVRIAPYDRCIVDSNKNDHEHCRSKTRDDETN